MRTIVLALCALSSFATAAEPQIVTVEENDGKPVVTVTATEYRAVVKQVARVQNGVTVVETVKEQVPVTVRQVVALDPKGGSIEGRDGKPLDEKQFAELIKKGAIVAVSMDGQPVDPAVVKKNPTIVATVRLGETKPSYSVLGGEKGRVALVNAKGEVEWEYATKAEVHDLALLPNGNILLPTGSASLAEVTRDKKVVWTYEAKKDGYKGRIEIHAFQRLDDGKTMVAESGTARIVEVDSAGKVVKEVPLTVEHPNPHRDTRMARKLANGHYLVCHEGDGKVREYDDAGKVVWTYALDLGGRPRSDGHGPEGHGVEVFGAVRLTNGNTLIGAGNGNRVIEVNKDGKIVWELGQDELPGIKLAWVTMLQVLPNGNVIVGNCHAGEKNPQLFEVTREKKVVWTFKDFKNFGNGLAATQVIGVKGVIR